MKWYLFSIGLIFFIIYRSTKPGFDTPGVQNIVYSVSTKAADKKIIHNLDTDDKINKSDLNRFSKTAGVYKINNNYKTGLLCSCCGVDHTIFSMFNIPGLNKNILNEGQPERYPLYEGFYPAKSLLK
jgi:hypothetical protein